LLELIVVSGGVADVARRHGRTRSRQAAAVAGEAGVGAEATAVAAPRRGAAM